MQLDQSRDSLIFICQAVGKVLPSIGIDKACIAGTLFLVDVLHEAGFTAAYPLTTDVCVENAARVNWVLEFSEPVNEAMIETCNSAGGLTVNVGMKHAPDVGPNEWAGHLVAIIPEIGSSVYLIDLTIIQVNDRGHFRLPPIFAEVGAPFLEGAGLFHRMVRGCSVSYLARPDDLSFLDGLDLSSNQQRSNCISKLVETLRSM